MTITAILTGYKRPDNLIMQVEALRNQTIPPDEIYLWYNEGGIGKVKIDGIKTVDCNHNFKFHGRFALGQIAQTDHVAIFDDDSIPGNRWFESCLNHISNQNGIIGSSGVILKGKSYFPYINAGWNASPGIPRDVPIEVDLVGHAWFFKKETLKFLWMEEPVSWETCEDVQFSYLAQKYGKIPTYCVPHPLEDKSIWGSIDGQRMGTDAVASSLDNQQDFYNQRNNITIEYINKGWQPIYLRFKNENI